jgi:hypothetical protein
MTHRAKHAEQKRQYEIIKDIRNRIATGQTTTFKERNLMYMVAKKQGKKS